VPISASDLIGWLDTLIQGVLLGGLYALFAMGLSLAFGVMRLVNIAHGDLIVLSAFGGVALALGTGWSPYVAFVVVVPAMAALGYALQRVLLNRTLGGDIPAPAAGDLRAVHHRPEPPAGDASPRIRARSAPAASRPRASSSAAASRWAGCRSASSSPPPP
jgi:hypothetical protein